MRACGEGQLWEKLPGDCFARVFWAKIMQRWVPVAARLLCARPHARVAFRRYLSSSGPVGYADGASLATPKHDPVARMLQVEAELGQV